MIDQLPAVGFEAVRPRSNVSVLRSDIAGFVGRTLRGPIDRLVRVEGWREYQQHFGGLDPECPMTYAIRGYFANGGEIAHVQRIVVSDDNSNDDNERFVREFPELKPQVPGAKDATHAIPSFTLAANSPGRWAESLSIEVMPEVEQTFAETNSADVLGQVVLHFQVDRNGESGERFAVGLPLLKDDNLKNALKELDRAISNSSKFLVSSFRKLSIDEFRELQEVLRLFRQRRFVKTAFEIGDDIGPSRLDEAVDRVIDEPEVAILVADDSDVSTKTQLFKSLGRISESKSQLVVTGLTETLGKHQQNHRFLPQSDLHVVAMYGPAIKVADPVTNGTQNISPSGHVAGLISRMDRDRGAHFTPANEPLLDVIDLVDGSLNDHPETLADERVNRIRCIPGRGLTVWGGRTMDRSPSGKYVAHQRFLHRLVRGIRSVAIPLVAETNGPELWRTLTRAATSLLLQAFQGGALQGARPEEAFFVTCNEKNNPYQERVNGRVNCDIGVALATPMEFITIRIRLGESGELEVFE